jgi:hypothetical protein
MGECRVIADHRGASHDVLAILVMFKNLAVIPGIVGYRTTSATSRLIVRHFHMFSIGNINLLKTSHDLPPTLCDGGAMVVR